MGKDMDMLIECALDGVRFDGLTAARAMTLGKFQKKNAHEPEYA
jgi:hypothetical protein